MYRTEAHSRCLILSWAIAAALSLAAAQCWARAAPSKGRCSFETLPDGRLQVTCPRPPSGPAKGHGG